DLDPDGFDILELMRLRHPHPNPERAELPHQDAGDRLRQRLEQLHLVLLQQAPEARAHLAVVDGVRNAIGIACPRARQACSQLDAYRLLAMQFVVVDADHGHPCETLYEDGVHRKALCFAVAGCARLAHRKAGRQGTLPVAAWSCGWNASCCKLQTISRLK